MMTRRRVGLALLIAFVMGAFSSGPSRAAQVTVDYTAKVPIVVVSGVLKLDDGGVFAEKISGLDHAIVLLSGPGGNLFAGLRIGTLIRLKNFATIVPDGVRCASACAFAWLGGTIRYMGQKAAVGFHAAYRIENGRATETGAGNALVGAYLDRLGLSDRAIVYITAAAPNDITWLSIHDARALGIDVTVLRSTPGTGDESRSSPPVTTWTTPPKIAKPQRPAGPSKTNLDDFAKAFAISYFAHWSESNVDALHFFGTVYEDTVNFYDRPISRTVLLQAKRRYAAQWPQRLYTARAPSIVAKCDVKSSKCTVTGQVEWECSNSARGARSSGVANFTLQITIPKAGPTKVSGEWSTVVARRE